MDSVTKHSASLDKSSSSAEQNIGSTPMRSIFGKLVTLTQVLGDFSAVFLCYMGSYYFYTDYLLGFSPLSKTQFLGLSAAAGVLYVFISDRVGLYRREISLLNIKEFRGIVRVGLYAAAVILSTTFYIRFTSLSRITITTAIIASPIMLLIERQIFYKLHVLFHIRGWSQTRVFVYGAGSIGIQIAKRLFESPSLGMLPVGFLDDDATRKNQTIRWIGVGPKNGVPVLGAEEALGLCKQYGVTHIIIATPSATFERNQKLVENISKLGIPYSIVPNAYEKFVQQIEMFEIGGIPLFRRRQTTPSYLYLFMKRIIDILLASIAIVLMAPFYLFIAIAIRADSKGPVIFKQKRVGYRGKEFSFYKFRSMYIETPKYAETPHDASDPRITKIGRWLRRTSLDELPQLFNVLRGDMSIVGPRPEMPFIVAQYTSLERRRLDAKPGITGVWQISAARGEPIHANMEYDLFYLENRSVLLDVVILAKTILSVIRGIGAI